MSYNNSTWQEVKLAADKHSAVEVFTSRQPLLLSLLAGRLERRVITEFVETVRGRPGRYLLIDPQEVLGGIGGDHRRHAEQFACILELLDAAGTGAEAVLEAVRPYVASFDEDPDRYVGQVLGYTYC